MLPEPGEGLCAACAAGPLVSGSPSEMLTGHVAADHCLSTYQWSHGWDLWVHAGIAAAALLLSGILSSPQNLLMHPDLQAGLPPEQKLEIRGVESQRGCCSELRSSHGRAEP